MKIFMNKKLLMILGVFALITLMFACDRLPNLDSSKAISEDDRGLNFTISGGGNNLFGNTNASTHFTRTAQRLVPNWTTTTLGLDEGIDITYRIDTTTNPVGTQGITQTVSAWPTVVDVAVSASNLTGIEVSIPAGVVDGAYFLNIYAGGASAGHFNMVFYINDSLASTTTHIANDISTGITYWGYEGDFNFIQLATGLTNLTPLFTTGSFANGTTARTNFNGDISKWNMGDVKNTTQLFDGASAFNRDISSWDLRNNGIMVWMFHNAVVFNQDVGSWNTASVVTFAGVFEGASSFNQDVSRWSNAGVAPTPGEAYWDMFTGSGVARGSANAPAWCPTTGAKPCWN